MSSHFGYVGMVIFVLIIGQVRLAGTQYSSPDGPRPDQHEKAPCKFFPLLFLKAASRCYINTHVYMPVCLSVCRSVRLPVITHVGAMSLYLIYRAFVHIS